MIPKSFDTPPMRGGAYIPCPLIWVGVCDSSNQWRAAEVMHNFLDYLSKDYATSTWPSIKKKILFIYEREREREREVHQQPSFLSSSPPLPPRLPPSPLFELQPLLDCKYMGDQSQIHPAETFWIPASQKV